MLVNIPPNKICAVPVGAELARFAKRVALERKQKAIQQKLDRLDEAFLYERSIDIERYDRHRDKLREELTLVQMDRHATELEDST